MRDPWRLREVRPPLGVLGPRIAVDAAVGVAECVLGAPCSPPLAALTMGDVDVVPAVAVALVVGLELRAAAITPPPRRCRDPLGLLPAERLEAATTTSQ